MQSSPQKHKTPILNDRGSGRHIGASRSHREAAKTTTAATHPALEQDKMIAVRIIPEVTAPKIVEVFFFIPMKYAANGSNAARKTANPAGFPKCPLMPSDERVMSIPYAASYTPATVKADATHANE